MLAAKVAEIAARHAVSYRRGPICAPSRFPSNRAAPRPRIIVEAPREGMMQRLCDLARARRLVIVETTAGRRWSGRIAVVAVDYLELSSARTAYRRRIRLAELQAIEGAA